MPKKKLSKKDQALVRAFKLIHGARGNAASRATKVEEVLRVWPILLDLARNDVITLPIPLISNVSVQEYKDACEKYEVKARHLELIDGTIMITELFRGAHEGVLNLVRSAVESSITQVMGAETIFTAGSYDIEHHNGRVQPDTSFQPNNLPVSSATLLIQILDSETIQDAKVKIAAVFASAANNVQGCLLVKLVRYVRPAVPAVPNGQRGVGQHTFSDAGFAGDQLPVAGTRQTTPVSAMIYIYLRRGVAAPVITVCGLGTSPAFAPYYKDDLAIQYPGVVANGANVGPYIPNDPNFRVVLPWADLYFVAGGVMPANIAAVLANAAAAGPGITIDPYDIWRLLPHAFRYHN